MPSPHVIEAVLVVFAIAIVVSVIVNVRSKRRYRAICASLQKAGYCKVDELEISGNVVTYDDDCLSLHLWLGRAPKHGWRLYASNDSNGEYKIVSPETFTKLVDDMKVINDSLKSLMQWTSLGKVALRG